MDERLQFVRGRPGSRGGGQAALGAPSFLNRLRKHRRLSFIARHGEDCGCIDRQPLLQLRRSLLPTPFARPTSFSSAPELPGIIGC